MLVIKTTSALLLFLLCSNLYANNLCQSDEVVAFSCDIRSKTVSVCVADEDSLVYRFGKTDAVELTLNAPVHFSSTAYSGGGEGRLRFPNGRYDYVVYSGITNGEWLDKDTGLREKVEFAGILVLKDKQVLSKLKCSAFADKSYIHDLPQHKQEPFVYYD
ncbi:MAG TPA: hypothetical protein ENI26_02650 [Methylophaga aminisulfidivorans]|uniref:Uncharacterized protein n=1 Tax=Methylophaga aminisulfidivorans TaxID=230105 RepID=A0A7C2AA27_9GAMM|nr:hypothetical protein [Methylophaga aminisulfidivorans]